MVVPDIVIASSSSLTLVGTHPDNRVNAFRWSPVLRAPRRIVNLFGTGGIAQSVHTHGYIRCGSVRKPRSSHIASRDSCTPWSRPPPHSSPPAPVSLAESAAGERRIRTFCTSDGIPHRLRSDSTPSSRQAGCRHRVPTSSPSTAALEHLAAFAQHPVSLAESAAGERRIRTFCTSDGIPHRLRPAGAMPAGG
jgi:hypothetical protein